MLIIAVCIPSLNGNSKILSWTLIARTIIGNFYGYEWIYPSFFLLDKSDKIGIHYSILLHVFR